MGRYHGDIGIFAIAERRMSVTNRRRNLARVHCWCGRDCRLSADRRGASGTGGSADSMSEGDDGVEKWP